MIGPSTHGAYFNPLGDKLRDAMAREARRLQDARRKELARLAQAGIRPIKRGILKSAKRRYGLLGRLSAARNPENVLRARKV